MTHELFRRYPLVALANTRCGAQPVPYHVYDGEVFLIGATANRQKVEKLLENEALYPIVTSEGRALMALWICDFRQASHGAHSEIQFSIFVSRSPMPPVKAHPLALLPLLLLNPEARMLIHGIWNDSPAVVAYNNEVLGLGAKQAKGTIRHENGLLQVDYAGILSATIHTKTNTPPKTGLAMLGALGWQGIRAFSAQPYLNTQALNRVGRFKVNATAQTFTHNDKVILQDFDSHRDKLEIQDADYANIDFQPTFFEQMQGFKFVYLNPHDLGDSIIDRRQSVLIDSI